MVVRQHDWVKHIYSSSQAICQPHVSAGKTEVQKIQARYEAENNGGGYQANQSQVSSSGRVPDLMLRKDDATNWIEECQKALDKIKEYLSKQPVLVLLEPITPLLLYLSVLDGAFGCIQGQHDETRRKEQAIYYLSKKFTPYEARYSSLERICCVLT
uniref:Reverse transcriptase/retrotransposon-derived protein RNase H-like domain-containing protein n=1 Tax=Nicotiana tabacum TaxID=4097 RepID=A0A1S3XR43_TOBAC|nr:PREDICTED: uncharacterized protein LOC107767803 [Nicotiana tabacum]